MEGLRTKPACPHSWGWATGNNSPALGTGEIRFPIEGGSPFFLPFPVLSFFDVACAYPADQPLVLLTFSATKSPLLIFFPPGFFLSCHPGAATKYTKAEQLSLRERLARLNTHSIAKKTTRLSRLLLHEAGIVAKVGTLTPCPRPGTCCPSLGRFWGILLLLGSTGPAWGGVGWLMLPPSSQGPVG